METLIWLTEADVVSLVDLDDAIDALERGLAHEGRGEAKNLPKVLGTWGDGSSMHALGSMAQGAGVCGFKTWVNTKRGATAVFTLFDADNGRLLAAIEAAALGQLRTSAISGVATRWMAREEADEMALVGTGLQAMTQVAAVAAVRPLRRLRVFSPTAEKRQAFVAKARDLFAFPVEEAASVEAAVKDAPIVTTITRAVEPFLTADMLAKGAHLNAVGAILPDRAEFTQDVFARVGMMAVDSLPNVKQASREFVTHYQERPDGWDEVKLLSQVIVEGRGRPAGCDLSLFKAMGMGLSDLSVAILAHERARARGAGQALPAPRRVPPTWRAGRAAAKVA